MEHGAGLLRQADWRDVIIFDLPSGTNTANGGVNGQQERSTFDDLESSKTSLPMRQLKTYIVEDSLVIRENLIATLEELVPVEVVGVAEDEATAVHWLAQSGNVVDLVIVDIFLKGGSGLGVLRAAAATPHLCKLVVLTNYASPDMRRICLELGADKVFDKSNDIEALILYCEQLASESGSV